MSGASWGAVSKWNAIVQATPMSEEDYAVLHPMIVDDICKHFRYEEADGTRIPIHPKDFNVDNPSFGDMRDMFLAMKRKMGGSDMHERTHANQDIVEKEMKRGSWPKGKPPDIASW